MEADKKGDRVLEDCFFNVLPGTYRMSQKMWIVDRTRTINRMKTVENPNIFSNQVFNIFFF